MSRNIQLILYFSLAGYIFAQESPWILLEKGKIAWEKKNFAEALDITLQAANSIENYPEAEYWLGKIYAGLGQLDIAEEQYKRALNLASWLRVPQDRYSISYALAEIYEFNNRDTELTNILVDIAREEGFSSIEEINLEHRYIEILTDKGLDDLLYLYRSELNFSLTARRILGEKAWNDGQYRTALVNSIRTVMSLLSTAAFHFRQYDTDWRFDIDPVLDELQPDRDYRYPGNWDGTMDLLNRIVTWIPSVNHWLKNNGLWPQLYLLSVSLYAEGYENTAQELWELLVAFENSGRWGTLASRQIEKPFITVGSLEP